MQKYRSLAHILFIITFWISVCLTGLLPSSANPYAQVACPNPTFTAQMPKAAAGRPRPIATGDFDRDGKMDLAIANSINIFSGATIYNVTILLNDGAGGFTVGPGSPIGIGEGPISIASADFNNDAKTDLAVASERSNTV